MTREELETRDNITLDFTNKWKYRYDSEQYGSSDAWVIIRSESEDGKFAVINIKTGEVLGMK